MNGSGRVPASDEFSRETHGPKKLGRLFTDLSLPNKNGMSTFEFLAQQEIRFDPLETILATDRLALRRSPGGSQKESERELRSGASENPGSVNDGKLTLVSGFEINVIDAYRVSRKNLEMRRLLEDSLIDSIGEQDHERIRSRKIPRKKLRKRDDPITSASSQLIFQDLRKKRVREDDQGFHGVDYLMLQKCRMWEFFTA